MPVKFPVSGRYANYQPIAIHTAAANLHSAQNCSSDSDDCTAANAPMHCRAIVYHPATVYIPHAPPLYHGASGTASLLPTPYSASSPHQSYDSNAKTHAQHNLKDCGGGGKYTGGQGGNYTKGGQQNHGYHPLMHHQNTHSKSSQYTQGGSQSHNHNNNNNGKCSGNGAADGSHKYQTIAMSSRLPIPYNNKRTAGSNVGSPAACFLKSGGGGYGSNQTTHRVNLTTSNYGAHNKPTANYLNANVSGYEHAANGRRSYGSDDQTYYDIGKSMSGSYGSGRKGGCLPNNNYRGGGGGGARLDAFANDSNNRPNNDVSYDAASQAADGVATTLPTHLSSTNNASTDTQEKPAASPPPAPYSPMTRPLPTVSPPTSQVQFYSASAQNRYQQTSSMPPSQAHQQQHQQQSIGGQQQRRYSVAQTLSSTNRKPSDKYSNTGSQTTTMLRQPKYKVNGIMQSTAAAATKLNDDGLGGAGDGPTAGTVNRMPITPPGTPRGHPAAGDQMGDQLSETCHQMQALTL